MALVAPAGAVIDQDASPSPGAVVSAGLVALCAAATDDGMLKRLNLDVLMHTRAEDARVRIFALRCARALWTAHGSSKLIGACGGRVVTSLTFFFLLSLLGFATETATFIAECAEDEHDGVVSETHALKAALEGATGEKIEGL